MIRSSRCLSCGLGSGLGEGISFLKTVNTLLSESTEGRTRHTGGRAFARTVRVWVRGGISFLKTVNTILSESTEDRTRHKGGRAFARTGRVRVWVRVRVRVRVEAWDISK